MTAAHEGMAEAAREAARIILDCGLVYTRTSGDPFFFSSGWASPVFIDIKRLISLPGPRERVLELSMARIDAEIGADGYAQIAGCELAGVPFAAMVADRRRKPLVIARKQGKGFGRLAQIEGTFEPGASTLLVDDLTTDGRTKETFRNALMKAEADVVGIFVVLNYGIFRAAPRAAPGIFSLVTLPDVLAAAAEGKLLDPGALHEVEAFVADAGAWSRRHGGIGALPS